MGYRSDVTIIMYPSENHRDKFAALKLFVDENLPDEFEEHEVERSFDEVVSLKGGSTVFKYLMLERDSVKWYDDFEEVEIYNKLFSEWDKMFADPDDPIAKEGLRAKPIFNYEFMRIGENYDDIAYDCSSGAANILRVHRDAYVNL